jgi:hypothetical protein
MDTIIDPSLFAPAACTIGPAAASLPWRVTFPADVEGRLETTVSLLAGARAWSAPGYLWFDAVNCGPNSMALTLSFWDEDNPGDTPDLVCTTGLLPDLPTRVAFPFGALDTQRMFLPRTPGRLKTVIHGTRVRSLARFALGAKCASHMQHLEIGDLHLTAEEPTYPVPTTPLIDLLGQWSAGEWRGKTRDAAAMARALRERHDTAASTATGPWSPTRLTQGASYFRTHHDGARWWLVDPEGYAFWSAGVDCVRPGEGCNVAGIEALSGHLEPREGEFSACWAAHGGLYNHAVANLIRVFGEGWWDAWSRITRDNLVRWGFNTIGNWSDPRFARASALPWVYPMEGFPSTPRCIFRDFPDVFSPAYERSAASFARQMEDLRDDRALVGYFLRNEPEWAFIRGLDLAQELLDTDFPTDSRAALIGFLSDRYGGDVARLNAAWRTSFGSLADLERPVRAAGLSSPKAADDLQVFSRRMVERYVRLPSEAVRRVDPNHLNLGMRYAYIASDDLLAGSDCFDVFSINCYDEDPREAVEKAGLATRLPVMIGEFHFGALDRGLSATGIRGAAGQTDRGLAYRYYVERAAASAYCVGAHYFQYCEQPTLGRFDGENYDIGLVDVCQTPLAEFLEGVVACHRGLQGVAAGERAPTEVKGRRIHPIFF